MLEARALGLSALRFVDLWPLSSRYPLGISRSCASVMVPRRRFDHLPVFSFPFVCIVVIVGIYLSVSICFERVPLARRLRRGMRRLYAVDFSCFADGVRVGGRKT